MRAATEPSSPSKRRGRRFPFKARTVAEGHRINHEISSILKGVDDMIYGIARTILPKDTDTDTMNEIVQECRVWLWRKSLPKYDAWRRPSVKVSTFLHKCAHNFICQEKRKLIRSRRQGKATISNWGVGKIDANDMLAPENSLDRKIEAIATAIIDNPERFMTPSQTTVFKAVLDNPETMMKDLAKGLKYCRESSLSMIKRRIRERIASLDIEEIDLDLIMEKKAA